MNKSKPNPQHADAVHSGAFTGNLQRASLLPGEIAMRPPISQEAHAAAGAGGHLQPAGANLYRRDITGGMRRPWWHWPTS